MRWRLRNQFLVTFALITLIAVGSVSGVSALLAARRTERQIAAQLDAMAATLRNSSFPLTDAVLRQVRGLSGVEIVALDARGRLVAASLPPAVRPDFLAAAPALPAKLDTDSPVWPILQLGETAYFDRRVAMRGERERGSVESGEPVELHLLYPESVWQESRRQAAVPPMAVGAVTLVLVALAAVSLANRLSRPIDRLGDQVARIADGDYRPLPLPSRDDELRDLTAATNRLAGRLSELTDSLRRGERLALLGQLSGGLAHQLRNSIAGAKMAVQLHARDYRGEDDRSLHVALRQLALTEEHLRTFLTAGEARPPLRTPCDLSALVSDVLELVEPAARHRKATLDSAVEPIAPPLSADAQQLRELLVNLLLNAVEAVGAGGRVGVFVDQTVWPESSPPRPAVRLRVVDDGPGPPSAIQDRLFEPFVTGKPEGIGLGLAAARRVAENHGGRLDYTRSDVTCFTLLLPLDAAEAAA